MQNIDFKNTQIAFRAQSNFSLRFSYWIFRFLGFPLLVQVATFVVRIALFLHLPVKPLIRATVFKQFCGGENLDESLAIAKELSRFNVGTILDYAAEGGQTEELFEATASEILRTIELAKRYPFLPFSVFKPSGVIRFSLMEKVTASMPLSLQESLEWKRAKARVQNLCQKAYDSGVCLFIDAEESWIQGAIDGLAEEMMQLFNERRAIVYNTIQMYRQDRLDFLKRAHERAKSKGYILALKVVRGAYLEKENDRAQEKSLPSPIYPTKGGTDSAYDAAVEYCLKNIETVSFCAGTHNDTSTALLVEQIAARGLSKQDPRIYFSQLKGMSDNLTFNLADAGFNVAKYVPYASVKVLIPYLTRRAKENTAMAGQSLRELAFIKHEIMRRKVSKVL